MHGPATANPHPELQSLQASYGMPPALFVPELPRCGISVFRFRQGDDAPSRLIEHRLQTYTLSLILRPMAVQSWRGSMPMGSGPIRADAIRLTPPGMNPRWQSNGAFDFLLFTIPCRTIEAIAKDRTPYIQERLRTLYPRYLHDPTALQLLRQIVQACQSTEPYAQHMAGSLALALLAHLLNQIAGSVAPSKQTTLGTFNRRVVMRYIAQRLDQPLSIAALAQTTGLSASHFAHAFRASMGMAPHRFMMSMRIKQARVLLKGGAVSIGQAARDCGFKDASHFSRVFRRHTGLTPREFRLHHL